MLLKLQFKPNVRNGELNSYDVYAEIEGLGAFDSLEGALILAPEEADALKGRLLAGDVRVVFDEGE